LGLVECRPETEPRLCFTIALTERGKKVAALQIVNEKFVSGEFSFETESVDEKVSEILSQMDKEAKTDENRLQMAVLRA
jgi:hypothetical protein